MRRHLRSLLFWRSSYTATPRTRGPFHSPTTMKNTKVDCLRQSSQLGAVLGPNNWCAFALCRSSPITFHRPPERQVQRAFSQNTHDFRRIWQAATLLSNDAARRSQWPKIAGAVPKNPDTVRTSFYRSTFDVTYDSNGWS